MYLARREFGGKLRTYPLREDSEPIGWIFDPWENPNGVRENPAICEHGVAATGATRAEAVTNMKVIEDAL